VEEHDDDVGVEAAVVRAEGVGLVQRLALLVGSVEAELDLSIFRAEPKKNLVISGRKNPAHDHPTGRVEPQFSGRARVWAGCPRIL
jgi:hypothetical protein